MKTPKRKADWIGLTVRTRIVLRNSQYEIPAGTVCKVLRNYGGLSLKAQPCPHCRVAIYIKKVCENEVELIDPQAAGGEE